MENTRKRYNADYKAKIALEAIREQKTLSELSGQYGIHSNQITDWKKTLKDNAFLLFEKTGSDTEIAHTELMDAQYLKTPFYGVRRMWAYLQNLGYDVNIKRIKRLYKTMGLECVYPKPHLSVADAEHQKYPYLLRCPEIVRPNQVWSTDITYVPMSRGFLYLVAVMDYVLSWKLSNSMDVSFCIDALLESLCYGTPEIFNTDQGAQFTSNEFTGILQANNIKISMDGRGRALDNLSC